MLGLFSLSHTEFPCLLPPSINFRSSKLRNTKRLVAFAGDSGNGANGESLRQDSKGNGTNGIGGGSKDERRPIFNLKLGDLLEPEPDNIVAIGLTCVLTWASVQVLWQLFFISLAILVAALKYSFIAALLIFILITLL